MKTSFMTLFALGGMFAGVLAAPTANVETSMAQKRDNADVASVLTDLYSTIQGYTATINSTTAALNSESTAADNSTASDTVNTAVSGITSAVNDAIPNISSLAKRALVDRQTTVSASDIGTILSSILLDISGALNNVIASLGLTSLLGFLTPLTTALSQLVSALEVVVDDLLAVVKELLDGILSGLSAALAGLVL